MQTESDQSQPGMKLRLFFPDQVTQVAHGGLELSIAQVRRRAEAEDLTSEVGANASLQEAIVGMKKPEKALAEAHDRINAILAR